MPDDWEILYGFDPLDPSDAYEDADGDGVSNLDEYLQGTNPRDDLGAVGSWSFDEGSGTTVTDVSGLDNHGSFVGSPSWIPGVSGSALEFAGNGERVLVPDAPSLDLTDALTIAVWMRPNQRGTQYLVKKARYDATDGYELSLSNSKRQVLVRFNQASSGNTYRVNSVTLYPTDGTWLHVAATYDGQEIKLYIDGVLESSLPAPGLSIAANDLPLSIGAQDNGLGPYQGTVDQVHVYSVALSQGEIQSLIAAEEAP
jgi:hypothetical protein